jgi:hypothetical protein
MYSRTIPSMASVPFAFTIKGCYNIHRHRCCGGDGGDGGGDDDESIITAAEPKCRAKQTSSRSFAVAR